MFVELLEIAKEAALAAGKIIESTKGTDLELKTKEGGESLASTVVTEIDLKAQNAILEILGPTLKTYDLGLLTEESPDDKSRFEKDYFWSVDPLDGTLHYAKGEPGYSTSIALVSKDGLPIIGVVYNPITNDLYHAIKDQGAFKNGNPLTIKTNNTELNQIPLAGAVMMAINTIELAPALFIKKPKEALGGGSLWDYAATSIIQSEAGGFNSDFYQVPLDLNRKDCTFMNHRGVIYCSSRDLLN